MRYLGSKLRALFLIFNIINSICNVFISPVYSADMALPKQDSRFSNVTFTDRPFQSDALRANIADYIKSALFLPIYKLVSPISSEPYYQFANAGRCMMHFYTEAQIQWCPINPAGHWVSISQDRTKAIDSIGSGVYRYNNPDRGHDYPVLHLNQQHDGYSCGSWAIYNSIIASDMDPALNRNTNEVIIQKLQNRLKIDASHAFNQNIVEWNAQYGARFARALPAFIGAAAGKIVRLNMTDQDRETIQGYATNPASIPHNRFSQAVFEYALSGDASGINVAGLDLAMLENSLLNSGLDIRMFGIYRSCLMELMCNQKIRSEYNNYNPFDRVYDQNTIARQLMAQQPNPPQIIPANPINPNPQNNGQQTQNNKQNTDTTAATLAPRQQQLRAIAQGVDGTIPKGSKQGQDPQDRDKLQDTARTKPNQRRIDGQHVSLKRQVVELESMTSEDRAAQDVPSGRATDHEEDKLYDTAETTLDSSDLIEILPFGLPESGSDSMALDTALKTDTPPSRPKPQDSMPAPTALPDLLQQPSQDVIRLTQEIAELQNQILVLSRQQQDLQVVSSAIVSKIQKVAEASKNDRDAIANLQSAVSSIAEQASLQKGHVASSIGAALQTSMQKHITTAGSTVVSVPNNIIQPIEVEASGDSDPRFNIWTELFGGTFNQAEAKISITNSDIAIPKYDGKYYGGIIGADISLYRNVAVGVSGGYTTGTITQEGVEQEVTCKIFAGYGNFAMGNFDISGQLAYLGLNFGSGKNAVGNITYKMTIAQTTILPNIEVQYSGLSDKNDVSTNNIAITPGVKIMYTKTFDDITVTPFVGIGISIPIYSSNSAAPTPSANLPLMQQGTASATQAKPTVGVTIAHSGGFSTSITYNGSMDNQFNSHQFALKLGMEL